MVRPFLWLVCGCAILSHLSPHSSAAPPSEANRQAAIVGQPTAIEVHPKSVALAGPRTGQQVLVTGRYADGSQRDLTSFAQWKASDSKLVNLSSGFLTSRQDGQGTIEIRVGEHSARLPITVKDSGKSVQVGFRREVMPVLSAGGCSDIRCHGAPSGKNGFRLSLWGSNPEVDFEQLTRAGDGRRTDAIDPEQSLILLKATGRVPHAGRKRFNSDSHFARLFRDWQKQGLKDDDRSSQLRTLTITPFRRVLRGPARWQQLAVTATFDDGRTVDVTRLTTFSTTDRSVASVSREGLVEFRRQGESAVLCRFLGQLKTVRLTHIANPVASFKWPHPQPNNYIDKLVFAKLKMMNVAPSELCSDEQFVRRVYLDACGILPSPLETRRFLTSSQTNKRGRLIERLLHQPEYAEYWTKKWMDVLRVSRDSIQFQGSKAYQTWLYKRINNDASFAGVVRELITSQGQSYKNPATNFYCVARTPQRISDPFYLQKDLAEATAQLFLGVRLQCAKCHNHPYERWTQSDYLGLAAFFAQINRTRLGKAGPKGRPDRRQMAIGLNRKAKEVLSPAGKSVAPRFPGQPSLKVDPKQDRRQLLSNWLTNKKNPFFAKAVVNRVWFHLHGRGIVDPVDDFRDSNPSSNDPLLLALADDFVVGDFRLRPLIKRILNSRTYQLSTKSNRSNQNDTRYFSHMMARPLSAEVLLDAICEVTGAPEIFEIKKDYTIGIPKGIIKIPAGTRAVQLPVNDIVTLINTSGAYVRYESHPFLRTFGQPNRTETCECDRQQNFGRKQALELIVGQLVTRKLSQSNNRLGKLLAKKKSDPSILAELYVRAVSRQPSPRASTALLNHVARSKNKRQAWEDVLWAILNSKEFIYQH